MSLAIVATFLFRTLPLSAQTPPEVISLSPPRQIVEVGATRSLSVVSSNTSSYQWRRNGRALPGANGPVLEIKNADPRRHNGWYQVVLTNTVGQNSVSRVSSAIFVHAQSNRARVVGYGDNSSGQLDIPANAQGALEVSVGSSRALALKPDGTVVEWGLTTTGIPPGITNAVAVSAGRENLLLRSDGTVVAWGNPSGSTTPNLTGVVAIAAGTTHNLALKGDGTVVGWQTSPFNNSGQSTVPLGLIGVVGIATGSHHSLAVSADGTVSWWGGNFYGENNIPPNLSNIVEVAAGYTHNLALTADGNVVGWGKDINPFEPPPADLAQVSRIYAAGRRLVALKMDGSVVQWGFSSPHISQLRNVLTLGVEEGNLLAVYDSSGDTAPRITQPPQSQSIAQGANLVLSVQAVPSFPEISFQWRKDGRAIPNAKTASLTIQQAQVSDAGSYDVVVTNYLGSVISDPASVSVLESSPPAILQQPAGVTAKEGAAFTLTVAFQGSPQPLIQWYKNGVAIPGANSASYTVPSAEITDDGSYTVNLSNSIGGATYTTRSSAALVTVQPGPRLSNLSVRSNLGAGETMIVGAVITGGAKTILVRGAGPALNQFQLKGQDDPTLRIFDSRQVLVSLNDNWDPSLSATFAKVGAFPFDPGSRDAALEYSASSAFTIQCTGTTAGVVLVEAYDIPPTTPAKLINLSARHFVGTGSNILIVGFSLSGNGTKRLLIRAAGPGLSSFGVPGVIDDPIIRVHSSTGLVIGSNDDWPTLLGLEFNKVGAFPFSPGSKDAALLLEVPAGASYTAQVSGVNNATGIALVEIYEVPGSQ